MAGSASDRHRPRDGCAGGEMGSAVGSPGRPTWPRAVPIMRMGAADDQSRIHRKLGARMTLARKLARLEGLVVAQSAAMVPTYWTPERVEGFCAWAERLLHTMQPEHALSAFDELVNVPAEQWGPVTRRLHDMACRGADGRYAG